MHIAHHKVSKVHVEQLAKMVGLKRRQIAYLAKKGRIPDAICPDGYHYQYPLTPQLSDWIEWKHRLVERRKQANSPESRRIGTDREVITIRNFRRRFDVWLNRVGGVKGILKKDDELRREILGELQPFARLHQNIYRSLNQT
jgi:hypothetical protein